jgi:hypothetical protein
MGSEGGPFRICLITSRPFTRNKRASVKNNKPKKLKKPNVLDKKQSPTRSGMQGLYERGLSSTQCGWNRMGYNIEGRSGVALPKLIQIGSTAIVRLHDGREVEAKITKIVDSVAGRKVHISFSICFDNR